jgi:AraC family transcriptional regulator of adaptative response/methylated-DNA-[protein]-cysteine methyltransferase
MQKPSLAAAEDGRYEAVRRRDPGLDGTFYYAVVTTGVYCRPSCAARLAKREHVTFYATLEAAEGAGYRACKRCKPEGTDDRERMRAAIARACSHIESATEIPKLEELAAIAAVSPYHFHRAFKNALGVTPRRYAMARRAERLGAGVRNSSRVTDAAYEGGFGSSSGFYDGAPRALGMTPTAFRKHGSGEHIRIATVATSLGIVLVAGTARGICAVRFGDDPDALRAAVVGDFAGATFLEPDADFEPLVASIVSRIEGEAQQAQIPMDLRGTVFQRRVWDALLTIRSGERVSYGELARRLGTPKAVRAVAQAVAVNPAAVIVPCHRVVAGDGTMRGYRWGVERKRALLERERR